MKTLFDFFRERFNQKGALPFAPGPHMIQSAMRALKSGAPEETVLACLLHDVGFALHAPDHGYWGAQLVAPYVSEKVTWAIRYLSLAKTRSRRLNPRNARSAMPIIAAIEHADGHPESGATESSMSAHRQSRRQRDRRASADRARFVSPEGETVDCDYAARRT